MPVRVNGREISEREINLESAQHAGADPRQAQREAAVALVIRDLLLERIDQAKLKREQPQSAEAEEAAIEALLARQVQVPEADEESCRRYYQANPERFHGPTLVEARHILLAAHPDDLQEREEAREQAEALIPLLQSHPERFEELARQYSDCPSKAQGGSLGQVSRGQTVPEFEEALLRLPVGLAPRPLMSRYGYHVVEVAQRIEGELLPFELVRERIAHYLTERARRRAISQYLQRLVGEARIEGIELAGAASPLVQ